MLSCRARYSLSSTSAVELALGVEALDAGVGVGPLLGVDPFWRCPFGLPVRVDAAGPAFLEEVGVVVTAEQGEVAHTALRVPSSTCWPAPDPI